MIATQIRAGNILVIDGEPARVTKTEHVTPGKGVACMQVKMKKLKGGQNIERRFRSSEDVEKAHLEQRHFEYLYSDGEGFHFMSHETYDTIVLAKDFVGDARYYLTENVEVEIEFYEEKPLVVLVPSTVELKVVETAPELRKATATESKKPATLETGLVLNVPPFIKEGDVIKIRTETGEYLERAK